MNRIKALAAVALFLSSGLANAVQLFLSPPASATQVGDTISVDLRVSDLGNFASPSLGAFYAEVSYAPSILHLESWSYGSFLGNPADINETDWVTDDATAGFISFDELSLLPDGALDAMQPAAFTLATLVFRGVGSGSSSLNLANVDLSDAFYSRLTPTAVTGATIQVNNSVPIAPPVWLMLPVGLWLARRRTGR
jgi:hypothetical protein